jgi:glycosyltransferase involved in cell wall biosynthesis
MTKEVRPSDEHAKRPARKRVRTKPEVRIEPPPLQVLAPAIDPRPLRPSLKVLMFSTDRNIFDAESPVRARLVEQASLVTELHVIVYTPNEQRYLAGEPANNLFIYPTRSAGKFTYLTDAYRFGSEVLAKDKEKKVPWVVTAQDPFETGAVAYIVARKAKLPLHLQLHTDMWSTYWRKETWKNRLRYPLGLYLLRRAKAIRVVSRRLFAGAIAAGIPEQRISIIPIFTDVAHFRDTEAAFNLHTHYSEFAKIVLSVGRLEPEKNFHVLIRAFARIHKEHDDAFLLIVGAGEERDRLLRLAASLDLSGRVKILPWARDTVSYYKTCDVYVQPSLYEGWGLAVVEAAASGAAIVMTDVGCAREVIKNSESGFIVPPANEVELAAAISRLLSQQVLRHSFGMNAVKAAEALTTKESSLELYRESWEKAVNTVNSK